MDEYDYGDPADGVVLPFDRASDNGAAPKQSAYASRVVDGGQFINQATDEVPAVWGRSGDSVIWAKGEPTMIVGPDGVGKTAIQQQAALCRVGIRDKLLGLPVERAPGKVLYIAADRPKQAARSMRRMVAPGDYEILRDRLVVWKGPLLESVIGNPLVFVRMAEYFEASDIFIDSLKDIAPDLVKDETGSHVSIAIQELIASDRELMASHHQRKAHQGAGKPNSLADVYGSRWLTACMGSVVCLWGEAGDPIVDFIHLKQPSDEVGPWSILHDHARGYSSVHESTDIKAALEQAHAGLTVGDAARLMFSTDNPNRNEVEKARRALDRLLKQESAERRDDPDGLARYHHSRKVTHPQPTPYRDR